MYPNYEGISVEGNRVRIVGDIEGYRGRIGHIVHTFIDSLKSSTGEHLFNRTRFIVELTPLDKEPIEEVECSLKDLREVPLKGDVKKCHPRG